MSGAKIRFTLDEVLEALDQNYAIPGDGEDSDIDSEYSESDTEAVEGMDVSLQDEEPDAVEDLHAVDMIESDDEDETSSRPVETSPSGRLASFDFLNTK